MPSYISVGKAAAMLGVCVKTLYRWEQNKRLIPKFRTNGGHRRYKRSDLIAFMRKSNNFNQNLTIKPKAAIYARVSGAKQKEDLKRQIISLENYCKIKKYEVIQIYKDIGSWVNDNRRGLLKMLSNAALGDFDILVINYNDRLARFGIHIIEEYLKSWDVEIDIRNPVLVNKNNPNTELITDLTAILYSFMGKLYRQRRGKNRRFRFKINKVEN